MSDRQNHSMDESEFETLDRLQISGSRADTFNKWMKVAFGVLINITLLIVIWALVFRAIPMMSSVKKSSDATAKGWNETITQAGEDIRAASANLNTITGNIASGTEDAKRLIKDAADETPRALRSMTEVSIGARRQLDGIGGQLQWLIRDTNVRLNGPGGLMEGLNATAHDFDRVVQSAEKVIPELAKRGHQTFDDLHAILGSQEWAEARAEVIKILKKVDSTAGHVDKTSAQVELTAANIAKASDQLPEIAQLLKKIASTNSKYQKAILLVRIFGILAAGIGALTL